MVLTVVAGVIAFALLLAVARFIAEVILRVFLALTAAVGVGIVGGIVAAQASYDGWLSGVAAAAIAFLPALVAVWKSRGPVESWLRDRAPVPVPTASIPVRTLDPIERRLGLSDADALVPAWEVAVRLAPNHGLEISRESCAKFLAAFDIASDRDPADIDLAVFIRRHVPGRLAETRAVLEQAGADERRETIAAMVSDLRLLGEDAERARGRVHESARNQLKVRLARFAYRADERGWQ